MIIVGLTGGWGTGKTTVARMFARLGAKILDADRISHSLIRPDTKSWKAIVLLFGKDVLNGNRTINRKKLGKIVFENKKYLKKLERIIHPLVVEEITKRLARIKHKSKNDLIIIDAPLLIEAGLQKQVDKLIVVKLERKRQIARLLKKSDLSRSQMLKRIALQMPLSRKTAMADYVIDNNRGLKNTANQVRRIWEEIKNE